MNLAIQGIRPKFLKPIYREIEEMEMADVLCSPQEGELVLVRVSVDSRHLEDVLEALAALPFPVNPDLRHDGLSSVVEFPAYEARLHDVDEALAPFELPVTVLSMLEAIQSIAI